MQRKYFFYSGEKLFSFQADCMGLGKTVQTVSFLAYLYEKKGVRNPHLILAPLSTLHGNWRLEFKKWWPSLRIVVYEGAKDVSSERKC